MKNLNKFINNIKLNNIECLMNLNDMISVHQYADFICNICGYKFNATLRKFVDKVSGCAKCSGVAKFTQQEVDFKVQLNNCARLGLYTQARVPFEVKCNTCGHEWKISLDNICRGKNCPQCAVRVKADNLRYTLDEIKLKLLENNFELISNFSVIYNEHDLRCLKCNFISGRKIHDVINELSFCQKCSKGIRKNERLIREILSEQNTLKYFFNYQIKKLGINKKFKVDFYFPDKNIIIEYNGLQHYQQATFGSLTRDPEKALLEQQSRDEYIRQMCINLNIKLIEIDGRNFRGKKLKKLILEIIAAIKLGDVNVYCKT